MPLAETICPTAQTVRVAGDCADTPAEFRQVAVKFVMPGGVVHAQEAPLMEIPADQVEAPVAVAEQDTALVMPVTENVELPSDVMTGGTTEAVTVGVSEVGVGVGVGIGVGVGVGIGVGLSS